MLSLFIIIAILPFLNSKAFLPNNSYLQPLSVFISALSSAIKSSKSLVDAMKIERYATIIVLSLIFVVSTAISLTNPISSKT